MNAVDLQYIVDSLVHLTNTPSPTGRTEAAVAWLEAEFQRWGLTTYRTNKGALLATLHGADDENQRVLSSHVDTLGAMVKEIKSDGTLRYTALGGAHPFSVEGEYCTIFTDDDRAYTGTILTTKCASHVYGKEAVELERKEANMQVRLDEKVSSADDVRALGIEVGDFIAFDPRTQVTDSGFIKSRHLDDKASVAILLGIAKYFVDNGIQPTATTHFFISNYEEVGHGAAAGIPPATRELIAVDMGCVGEGLQATERCVSICAKDSTGPYDRALRHHLVSLAREHEIPYAVDVYPFYGSDASAALRAGHDIRAIVIGPGVDASHAFERTHQEGLMATAQLLATYLQK